MDRREIGRWTDDLDSKTTLQVYRNSAGIGDKGIYMNMFGSVFRC